MAYTMLGNISTYLKLGSAPLSKSESFSQTEE